MLLQNFAYWTWSLNDMVRFIFISIFFFRLPFNFYNSFEIIPITPKVVQAITLHPSEAAMAKIVGIK